MITNVEELFDRESALRAAAVHYASGKSNESRQALRLAAIAYADAANLIDNALGEQTAAAMEQP